jgi:hypothetical protein
MSATPDSTFTSPEQRIADLERQLAECQAERDEYKIERDQALQRETATAEDAFGARGVRPWISGIGSEVSISLARKSASYCIVA